MGLGKKPFDNIVVKEKFHVRDVNPFPHNDTFWWVWQRSLLKTLWEKEKLLIQAISSFPTIFSTLSKTEIVIFVTFVIWKCFQFGLVQNFVMWEWVKIFFHSQRQRKSSRKDTTIWHIWHYEPITSAAKYCKYWQFNPLPHNPHFDTLKICSFGKH